MELTYPKFRKLSLNDQKDEIIKEIKKCAEKYNKNLLNKVLLIIYLDKSVAKKASVNALQVKFGKNNFYHLTGIVYLNESKKVPNLTGKFYENVLKSRISPKQISFKSNNSKMVFMKISILKRLTEIQLGAKMVGEYDGIIKNQLYCDVLVGGVTCCLGLVKEKGGVYFRPNSILKENIKDISYKINPIVAIFEKKNIEKQYTRLTYLNKKHGLDSILMNNEISNFINLKEIKTERKEKYIVDKINEWYNKRGE